jgi:hypothetical protein
MPNKSLQVSAGWSLSQLSWSGAVGCDRPRRVNSNVIHLPIMRITNVLIAVAICSSILNTASGQRRSVYRTSDVRLSKNHPTVYLTFERVGKRQPSRSGESNDGVWLGLHNNTRWALDVKAHGLANVFLQGNEKEVGVYYQVAATLGPSSRYREIPTPPSEEERECKVPLLSYGDLRSGLALTPGGSILFSVPREHLCKNLYVIVDFSYAWERKGFDEPQHSVRFYGIEIPKEAR